MNPAAANAPVLLALLALVGGLVLLVGGGELLVSGAIRLARRLGLSTLVIGLTVVAFGTSTPELFVSLSSLFANHPDIMLGNVVGSNIANIGLILGIAALMAPLEAMAASRVMAELFLLLGSSLLLVLTAWLGIFPRALGLGFIAALVLYTRYSYRKAAATRNNNGNIPEDCGSLAANSLKIIVGLLFLALGSHLFIKGAVDIARYFRISELVIGLTLAAVGTSLPELASTIAAIRHKQSRLLIGNIIGSNMFNLLMVLGTAAVLRPFSPGPELLRRDLPVMILFTVALLPLLSGRHAIGRSVGLLLLTSYGLYIMLLGW